MIFSCFSGAMKMSVFSQGLSGEFAVAGCLSRVSDKIRVWSMQILFSHCENVPQELDFCGKRKPKGRGISLFSCPLPALFPHTTSKARTHLVQPVDLAMTWMSLWTGVTWHLLRGQPELNQSRDIQVLRVEVQQCWVYILVAAHCRELQLHSKNDSQTSAHVMTKCNSSHYPLSI